jgi:thymidylate synthase ThyX
MTDDSLLQFVTNLDQPVFALRNLPEEVVAVLFAYYSRSAGGLRDNLGKLVASGDVAVPEGTSPTDGHESARDRAREFHEKWVVGYGHSSVAEHAIVHLAVEGVSILASKVIEDARLASFTEKSTRYVVFDEDRYYTPPCLADSTVYASTCRFLLGTYARLMPLVIEQIRERRPKGERQSVRGWETACKAAACDILRYLLPTATRTNIGVTANARTLEHLLSKMLSNPLEECRQIGTAMKCQAQTIVPTLIKYAAPNDYLAQLPAATASCFTPHNGDPLEAPFEPEVRLVSGPAEADIDLVSALLYEHGNRDWGTVRDSVAAMTPEARAALLRRVLADPESGGIRGKHDQPPRALEHLTYTFELVLDFGAYRDIQRHRMVSQTRQDLGTHLGFSMPPELREFGHDGAFHECMQRAAEAYATISTEHPVEAQYVLPMAYRVRMLFTWNLRELHHFISLRSGKQGHASYRKVAQAVWREVNAHNPLIAEFIRVDMNEYGLARG